LHPGNNVLAVVATPLLDRRRSGGDAGSIQILTPADGWKRKVFNGLAQVIVQSTESVGEITLKANAPGLTSAVLKLQVNQK